MRLSNSNLELLKTKPQQTKLYLSMFKPTAIFKARVNNTSAAIGDRVITFDTVSLGVYTYIKDGMTMWIGNTDGGQEIGKIRVRSATSTQITVSENSNIDWQDNLYLTVFDYWELWPVYPRIIQDPSNVENTLWYKDYDITYTNQNSILGTFVNIGPHRAANLDPATGQAQIYYSSTGTYNLLGDSLNYNWVFEGGTVTGSSSANPGYITYNTPGHYVTTLTVSGSNGAIDTTHRYVSIYNSANPPIQKWTLEGLQGSRGEGGYTASLKLFETSPIDEHTVVVIYGDNWYGSTKVNLGGNYPNAGDILFAGYVDKDSIHYDYLHSEVTFDAVSLTEIMKKSSGFAISVESKANPTQWYELLDLDSRRALYHYLRWHTTAMFLADFQFVGTDHKIQYFDSDRESMYDALYNHMANTLIGQVVSDRQGKIWMEVEARAYSNPTGSFGNTIMDITKQVWMGEPVIDERLTSDVSYVEYGGVAYSGVVTGTFVALLAGGPGDAPGFYGTLDDKQGLSLINQGQLNQLVGNIYANANTPFPNVAIDFPINASNLDIAPQESLGLNLAPSDTVRNKRIQGLYLTDSMEWKYTPDDFILLPHAEFKQLVTGKTGQTILIPDVSEIGGGFQLPSLETPPLPDLFPPTSNDNGDGGPPKVIVHDVTMGLIFTQTFDTSSPGWYQVNGGLTQTQYQAITRIMVCPNGAVYVVNDTSGVDTFIARADYPGAPFVILEDYTSISTKFSSVDNIRAMNVGFNPLVAESVTYVISSAGQNMKAFIGAGSTFTAAGTDFSHYANNGGMSISYGPSGWLMTTSDGTYWLWAKDLSAVTRNGTLSDTNISVTRHVRPSALYGNTLHWSGGSDNIIRATDDCTSDTAAGGSLRSNAYTLMDFVVCDDSGNLLCSVDNSSPLPIKSSDGGYSFSNIATLSPLILWYFAYAGGTYTDSKWIAVGSYVWYTNSFWNSPPYDKRGNITQIAPLLNLNAVKVVP